MGQHEYLPVLQDSAFYGQLIEWEFVISHTKVGTDREKEILTVKYAVNQKLKDKALSPAFVAKFQELSAVADSLLKQEQRQSYACSFPNSTYHPYLIEEYIGMTMQYRLIKDTYLPSASKLKLMFYKWREMTRHISILDFTKHKQIDEKSYWNWLSGSKKRDNKGEGNGFSFYLFQIWNFQIDLLEQVIEGEKNISRGCLSPFRPQYGITPGETMLDTYFGQSHPLDVLSSFEKQMQAACQAFLAIMHE